MTREVVSIFEPRWWWDGSCQEPLRDAQITVIGDRITDISARRTRSPSLSATRFALPDMLLMPGWVNAHTHLELSHVARPPYRGDFVDWLMDVMRSGPADGGAAADAAVAGARESLRFGVTEVIDITRHAAATRPALDPTGLRVHSCGEVTGLGPRWKGGLPLHRAALDAGNPESASVTPGLSPHAPYSTDATWYGTCAADARTQNLTLTTHLAETPEEREFLANRTGPFARLWERLGGVPEFDTHAAGPVAWLDRHDVLRGTNLLAAHCNDLTDDDLTLLAAHNVTVVHCPRTHAYFQRPPFDLRRLQQAGIPVRLGTDSRASAPDLDIRAEVAELARHHPTRPLAELAALATRPATVGAPASLIAYAVTSSDPLRDILNSPTPPIPPAAIWLGGTPLLN